MSNIETEILTFVIKGRMTTGVNTYDKEKCSSPSCLYISIIQCIPQNIFSLHGFYQMGRVCCKHTFKLLTSPHSVS